MSFRLLYESKPHGDDVIVTADTYPDAPIEIGGRCMSIREAKRVRKSLKRAIKAAEQYHGARR